MKKFIVVNLFAVLAVTLCGCSNTNRTEKTTSLNDCNFKEIETVEIETREIETIEIETIEIS